MLKEIVTSTPLFVLTTSFSSASGKGGVCWLEEEIAADPADDLVTDCEKLLVPFFSISSNALPRPLKRLVNEREKKLPAIWEDMASFAFFFQIGNDAADDMRGLEYVCSCARVVLSVPTVTIADCDAVDDCSLVVSGKAVDEPVFCNVANGALKRFVGCNEDTDVIALLGLLPYVIGALGITLAHSFV